MKFSSSPDNLHILSDFDRTLTYGSQEGIKTPTLISLLRDGKHLTDDYSERAQSLFDRYHPLEISHELTVEEKKPIMLEWWRKHFELMIECWLHKSDISDVIEKSHLKLRNWVKECLEFLNVRGIPFIIISAGAIGDAIPLFLEKNWCNFPNIHYICNQFDWDEWGRAKAVREPLIHVFNKDETILGEIPEIASIIHERKNVVLLGDSLWDIGMIEGFDYDSLLKIGFLNPGSEGMRTAYFEAFDTVIENDGDFSLVNQAIRAIISE